MSVKKILIADDEKRMRKLVSDFLKKEGYFIIEANDGEQALDIFEQENDIDLVILDVMMPKYDGWMVCRKIRNKSSVPIIMLTARSEEFDELFGFEMGADEYVKKPFSPKILVARVNALLRRSKEVEKEIQEFGKLKIDDNAKVVYLEDEVTELSPKEYELLLYMINNKGVALSREQILNNVWGYDYFGELRTVDTHINRLRIKLENQSDLIHTVRGIGYRFEVEK
ncbi:response regulator transcription factor [Tepidibacter aestuarii]|uniref:response regulator transcription factor n=1 Tax=Tepidibacter aestuarii TaxID=2925782 RepID=UPI0020BE3094|nr:response regulator transcription factor [Tepidibacter aestuarii]CAH2214637.1 Transcriptional regulatory protein SrrA [Tepidibacter aestuarii]